MKFWFVFSLIFAGIALLERINGEDVESGITFLTAVVAMGVHDILEQLDKGEST